MGRFNDDTLMRLELFRLASFKVWPDTHVVRPISLAKAGFFYTGEKFEDEVKCFSCKVAISHWFDKTDPDNEHQKASPNCHFMSPTKHSESESMGNIPIASNEGFPVLNDALHKQSCLADDRSNLKELGLISNGANNIQEKSVKKHSFGKNSGISGEGKGASTKPRTENAKQNSIQTPSIQKLSPPGMHTRAQPALVADGPRNHGENTCSDSITLQAIIDRVPKTHRLSQVSQEKKSTDPRKRCDLTFMDKMRSEKARKNTFYDWPEGAWQSPADLAAAGFFYTGSADRCQCAFCRGVLRNWEPNDAPMMEHKKYFGECPFVNEKDVGNISLEPTIHQTKNNVQILPHLTDMPSFMNTGMSIMTQRPKNPDYAVEAARLATYDHPSWTTTSRYPVTQFAKAGFFYIGASDYVKCFFCDGGLWNWEPQDDPWHEHAKWFPKCPFVNMTKGETFVQEVQRLNSSQKALSTPKEHTDSTNEKQVNEPTVTYRIEAKEIKARMDTILVRTVIGMGYSTEAVRRAIEYRLRTTGDDFPNAAALVQAILTTDDSSNTQRVQLKNNGNNAEQDQQKGERHEERRTEDAIKKKNGSCENHISGTASNAVVSDTNASKKTKGRKGVGNSEYKRLIEQNNEMKEQRVCKICLDNDVNTVLLPCSHLICCAACSPALTTCPVCRQIIKGTVRIFLS